MEGFIDGYFFFKWFWTSFLTFLSIILRNFFELIHSTSHTWQQSNTICDTMDSWVWFSQCILSTCCKRTYGDREAEYTNFCSLSKSSKPHFRRYTWTGTLIRKYRWSWMRENTIAKPGRLKCTIFTEAKSGTDKP